MVVKVHHSCFALAFVVTGACTGQTYNDCILDAAAKSGSSKTIDLVDEACRRKFEKNQKGQLDISIVDKEPLPFVVADKSGEGSPPEQEMQVTNPTDLIVTQLEIEDATKAVWTYNTWIEPGRWVVLDLPKDIARGTEFSKSDLLVAKARFTKVIEAK